MLAAGKEWGAFTSTLKGSPLLLSLVASGQSSQKSCPTPCQHHTPSTKHAFLLTRWLPCPLSHQLTLATLPFEFPCHTIFSDVVVGCLEFNLPKGWDQRKFTNPNYSQVPFSETFLCIFLKSPQTGGLPPDCSKCCHGEYSFRGYQGPPGPPGPPGIPGKDEKDEALLPV